MTSVLDLDSSSSEINLTNLRLTRMSTFSFPIPLTKLVLRQNLLVEIEPLSAACAETLKDLDLYENAIERIRNVNHLKNLVFLDLSFNVIREIEGLDGLMADSLRELYLINNKISRVSGLENLKNLKLLELGSNRIREIEGLDELKELEELWLGKNKITRVKGLEKLEKLCRISLQSNRLVELEDGFLLNVQLRELYLSHNGLVSMKGLENLVNLKILDLGTNQIKRLESIEGLINLTELWINHNLLQCWDDLAILEGKPISTLYFEGNPIAQDPNYKEKVLARFPQLKQLDWEELRK